LGFYAQAGKIILFLMFYSLFLLSPTLYDILYNKMINSGVGK